MSVTPPDPDLALAADLFERLRLATFDGVGITRESFGPGEGAAHDMIASVAATRGLEVDRDPALNLYVTLPGAERGAPGMMTGSHLDSVPRGGNFDGAAGVLAGLAVLSGWRAAGWTPPTDVTLMVVRAEESSWFPLSYIGSRAAFGALPAEALMVKRVDTGRTLAEHIRAVGGAPEDLKSGKAALDPGRLRGFIELHIEQGPVLQAAGEPVAAVTGIRGSRRYREAQTYGAYAHSGATPRRSRSDAVLATAHLVTALTEEWERLEASGRDLAVTFGRFQTDHEEADFAKVAGHVAFSLDMRSSEETTLDEIEACLHRHVAEIEVARRVRFDLGPRTGSSPAAMDPTLTEAIVREARALGVPTRKMACGAGHDASVFAHQGVPSAMIFVRNANGSHNPHEAMEFGDFALAVRILNRLLALA